MTTTRERAMAAVLTILAREHRDACHREAAETQSPK